MLNLHMGEPIASREITLRIIGPSLLASPELKFRIMVWRPNEIDHNRFCCQYQIEGLPRGDSPRTVEGADSLEALDKALDALSIVINCLPTQFLAQEDFFECNGMRGLGTSSMPELVAGLDAYRTLEFSRALALLHPYAVKGIAEIQLIMGSMYRHGPLGGVELDLQRSRQWLLASAAQGNGQAFWELSELALNSENLQEREAAENYAREAARHGFLMHLTKNR